MRKKTQDTFEFEHLTFMCQIRSIIVLTQFNSSLMWSELGTNKK